MLKCQQSFTIFVRILRFERFHIKSIYADFLTRTVPFIIYSPIAL